MDIEIHPHLARRMASRGVLRAELEDVLTRGWRALGARPGTSARRLVFPLDGEWQGRRFEEKEVTVYFKDVDGRLVVLTAIARYGADFPREDQGREG